ncbi:MAG: response regulator [Gammaproteobacteria bacterium]|nr:response regulator [Gammaproteobacteria bacterium]
MSKVSVAAIGMNPIDRKLLKSLFLLSDQNRFGFALVEGDQADVVVADLDGLDDSAVQAYRDSNPSQPILFISVMGGYRSGADPYITKPLKVNAVFGELNKLVEGNAQKKDVPATDRKEKLKPVSTPKKSGGAPAMAGDVPVYHADDYLLGLVQQAIATGQATVLSSDFGAITVFPKQGVYVSTVNQEDLSAVCGAEATAFKRGVVPSDQAEKMLGDPDVVKQGINELLWQGAYYASNGRLLEGCMRNDVVTLDYWPNITRLGAPDNAISICALLSRYPTSITLAKRILKVPDDEMYAFYSAATASGIARVTNRGSQPEAEPVLRQPSAGRGLLGKLLKKVTGL